MKNGIPAQERKHPTLRDAITAHHQTPSRAAGWKRDFVRIIVTHPNGYPASYASVAGRLLDYYGPRGICRLYLNTLSEDARVSRATTKRALRAFDDLGLVRWKRTGRYLVFSFPMEDIVAEIAACNERNRVDRIERQTKRSKARDIARAEVAATPCVLPNGCDDNEPSDGAAVSHRDGSPVSHRNPEQIGNRVVKTESCGEVEASEFSEDELTEVNKRLGDEGDPVGIPPSPTNSLDEEAGRRLEDGDDDDPDSEDAWLDRVFGSDPPPLTRAAIIAQDRAIARQHAAEMRQ
ncbi:hypothetical protein [Bradyrhizobium sp. WSM1417]|uniref:hypothetical protein n=1 Tax=Bradyrhizobium sp. WSM1417 TaxID=754500 RepID=UPI000485C331|nr:hypothetical protein [Bradyrhizobium sp. WSM1417]